MQESIMNTSDDNVLLLAKYASTSDAGDFAALVDRYQSLVYGACLRVLCNSSDAEDVTQECFLQLARKAGQIKIPLAAWLHRNATCMSIDHKRRLAAEARRETEYSRNKPSGGAALAEIARHI